MTQYHNKQGNLSLRYELRRYLRQTRGVSCTEDQIIIGCGLHYTLDILCTLFKDTKDIGMEEPGYNGARHVFENNGFFIHAIPSCKDGLDISSFKTLTACAAYVTPSHQFPYGTVLPIFKRRELLAWAEEKDAFIIEDDYDSEYRYDANPVPSLQSIDHSDRVIYIGTFSKSLSPSLRVNYMVLPRRLLARYHHMFSSYNSPVAWLIQETLAGFLHTGAYIRHERRMCAAYRKRHDVFVQEAAALFGNKLLVHGQGAGLHFLLELMPGIDAEALLAAAAKAEIRLYPLKPFYHNPERCPSNVLFAGYSLLDASQIRDGLRILKQVWSPFIEGGTEK